MNWVSDDCGMSFYGNFLVIVSYRFRTQGPGHTEAKIAMAQFSSQTQSSKVHTCFKCALEVQKYTLVLRAHLKQVCTFELRVRCGGPPCWKKR